jgi:uncharacterized protein
MMNTYLYKLLAPRATFAIDMSDAERAIMGQQVGYWKQLLERGTALVFGPVNDPAGSWGLAIVREDSENEVNELGEADPAITTGLARFEILSMPGAIVSEAPVLV